MLAMEVNDNAGSLIPRGVLRSFREHSYVDRLLLQ
jgi:hypothetical protein